MFIQQSVQTTVGLIQNIPKRLLTEVSVGQRFESTVVRPALAGDVTTVRIADSSLNIRTPIDLQAGQKLQLEVVMEQDKLALKIISVTQALKAGQQIAVEVVKLLAENRLLVQTSTQNNASHIKLPIQQFDIDTTQLSQRYQLGDKLIMAIVNTKPLSIQLIPEQVFSREQFIIDRLRQILPPSSPSQANLNKILNADNKPQLPLSVQAAVQQLITHILDKSAVTQTNALKQALSMSGAFTENKLLKIPSAMNQDFKVNVARVLNALEDVIAQVQTQQGGKPIDKLPAQVLSALLAQGKSPAQLLNILLSGKSSAPNSAAQTVLSSITSQEQATALIQLLTKSLSHQQQAVVTASRTPMQLSELMALFKEVDSVHKRLQYNQLTMLKEPETSNVAASWLFDLPIKDKQNVDLLQIQIDQQKKQAENDDRRWQVQLCLDTQNLGPVQASVTLHGDDVKIVIRAERVESARLLEDNLQALNTSLAKLNVSISHISCICDEVKGLITNNAIQTELTSSVDILV